MPEQSIADLQRLVDRSRRDSRHNYGAHPTGAGGSLHAPHPKQGAGRKQIGPGEFGLSRPPIGEIIRLHVHGHLGNGGEPALFESIAYQNGFNQATAPNPQLQLPYNAIYGIEGEVRWADGYTGGGEVWLYLDAEPYMQLPGFTEAWTRFQIAMEFDAQKGARLSLVVVHDDSVDHDLEGEVVVATKERLVQLVAEPQAEFYSIDTLNFDIVYGKFDGTVVSTVPISSDFFSVTGLTLVGTSLWVGGAGGDFTRLTELGLDGTIGNDINLAFAFEGLARDGSDFFVYDGDNDRLTKIDSSGNVLSTGTTQPEYTNLDHMTLDGSGGMFSIGTEAATNDELYYQINKSTGAVISSTAQSPAVAGYDGMTVTDAGDWWRLQGFFGLERFDPATGAALETITDFGDAGLDLQGLVAV